MAATERRTGVSRRGMTVLGKVPIAPKPINLPSQRSTFCWGSAGRFPSGRGVFGKFESALLDPVSSDENLESKPVTPMGSKNHGGGVGLHVKKVQSSSVNATTANMASNNVGKMEEPSKSNSYLSKSLESRKQEMSDTLPQKSGDGCVRGASVPPGFAHSGPHSNNIKLGVSSTDPQCCGVVNGMPSDTSSQQNGSHSAPGMPYRSGTKEREIIVIHMVGGPGFYGNYPPQIGFPESYNRNGGVFGNFPLQFGNFEPIFGLQENDGAHLSAATGSEFFGEHQDFICYEKDCYKGACHDNGRQRNGWFRGCNSFLGGVHGDTYDPFLAGTTPTTRSRSLSQRHLSRNGGRSRSLYQNGRLFSMEETTAEPVSEKRITLLTKVSQHSMQAKNSLKEIGDKVADPVSSAYLLEEFCEDEGKPPLEIFEARKATEDTQVETTLAASVSINADSMNEATSSKDSKVESIEVLSSKTTCNDKCLHCKGVAVAGGSSTLVCQACEKTTVCESNFSTSQCSLEPTEEAPVVTAGKDSCVDGCKADVKHVILDADNYNTNSIKSEAASKEQEIVMEINDSSIVSQSSNWVDSMTVTSLSSDAPLTKSATRHQKLVFRKKTQPKPMNKPGIRVSKAHIMTRKPAFQGNKVTSALSLISSSDPKEIVQVTKEGAVQKSDSYLASQLSHSKVFEISTSVSSVAPSKKNVDRQQKLVYRKRLAERAAIGPQPSENSSKFSQPTKSRPASSPVDLESEHEMNGVTSITSASVSKYHIIRRRVYHVVEGSEGDYYLPTGPSSSKGSSMQQLEKAKEKSVLTTAASSHSSDSDYLKLQDFIIEKKYKATSSSGVHSLQVSRSAPPSSRQEDIAAKKHARSGNQLSKWKPKVTRQTAGSENFSIGKGKENNTPASVLVDEASASKPGSLGLVGVLTTPHQGEVGEKQLVEMAPDGLFSESKSSRSGFSECVEVSEPLNQQDIREKCVEEFLENVAHVREVKSGSPKHAEEMSSSLGLDAHVIHDNEELPAAKEVKQTSSEEQVAAGNHKPFVKKKAMSYEKANEFHKVLIKRYKEKGQWKPKATLPKKSAKIKENVRASQDDAKASG